MKTMRTYYVVLTRAGARDPYYVVGPLAWRDAVEVAESFSADRSQRGWLPPDIRSRTNTAALSRWGRRNGIDTFFVPELLLEGWNYDALLRAVALKCDADVLEPVRSIRDLPALQKEEQNG